MANKEKKEEKNLKNILVLENIVVKVRKEEE